MNFTREPIIETIISPKEGHKLLIRNSKGGTSEEYYVDAVEVVSFGHGCFFRSLERPKAFVVPCGDYEVLEVKEARVALKNAVHERNIKIGGGREAAARQNHVAKEEMESSEESAKNPAEVALESAANARMDKRRDKRRQRRRRGNDEHERSARTEGEVQENRSADRAESEEGQEAAPLPSFSSLIPPPPTLISESISRYKEKYPAAKITEEEKEEVEKEEHVETPKNEEREGGDSSAIHRTAEALENPSTGEPSLISTFFSSLRDPNKFNFF